MFSIIGIVMLMGLVTKNAILLVDFAIRSRAGENGDAPMQREQAPMAVAQAPVKRIVIGEPGTLDELLALEQHRDAGARQHQRGPRSGVPEMAPHHWRIALKGLLLRLQPLAHRSDVALPRREFILEFFGDRFRLWRLLEQPAHVDDADLEVALRVRGTRHERCNRNCGEREL